MIELVMVIAVVLIISATALFQVMPAMRNAKAESALQITLGQIRNARGLAVDQRSRYKLKFTAPRTIQLSRGVVDPVTHILGYVPVSTIDLPQETQFIAIAGIPTGAETPDSLPTTGIAIDFNLGNAGGLTDEVYFQPDGRALDASGRLNSGVVYVARPGELMSSRAVSVRGATGRVKGWHLIQSGNNKLWAE